MTKIADKNKLFIPRGDVFWIAFSNYRQDKRFEEVRKIMRDRCYTVGRTKIAYRVINHWDQLGLLPEGVQGNGGWRKFTLPEVVWLRVIARMRDFAVPLEKIALTKKGAMEWDEKCEDYPYFEYYVAKAWFSTADHYVLVLDSGEAQVAHMSQIELAKLFVDSFDVLLISLKAVLKDLEFDVTGANTLRAVSDDEVELLGKVQHQNSREVRAKVDGQGKITEIESTEIVSPSLAPHEIKNHVKKEKMYGKVVTQYEDGVPQSVQITKRTKLKK